MIESLYNSPRPAADSQHDVDGENDDSTTYAVHKARATMTEEDFYVALKLSTANVDVLDLTNHFVCIGTTVKLSRSESLHIKGGTIVGECHSIFSMGTDRGYDNGPPALTLDGVHLIHTLTSTDKRAVGAAVFVMGKARVSISGCFVDSIGGFGVWVKHGGRVSITDTTFLRAGRSTMAFFNTAQATVSRSHLSNACVHGVCVRGDAQVTLSQCCIQGAGTRAAFVYQRGTLTMDECSITNTGNTQTPAVQAESIFPSDNAKLNMRRCVVKENCGPSLVINGGVEHVIQDNNFDAEVEINPDVTDATVPRPWTELEAETKAL